MDAQRIWKQTLDIVRLSISEANFSTWFSNTFISEIKILEDDKQIVEIGCPSSFLRSTIEERYTSLLQDALNQVTGKKNNISFTIKQNPYKTKNELQFSPLFNSQINKDELFEKAVKNAHLIPAYTFENFAVSSTNQMAWAAASAVAKNPGSSYNPLFIWGGVGVGKTHLMVAIGYEILKNNPNCRVFYCMGEEFTSQIIEAIKTKTTNEFKRKYRSTQVLLLDDIQFLAGKTAVQEEFFHTFNTIQREGGQIVMTSDRPPEDIQRLEERLRSRFEGGLIVDISPPDFELRTAILLIKAKQRGIQIPMNIAQLIASKIESPRKIEGFLIKLISESTTKGIPIDENLVFDLIGKPNGEKTFHPVSHQEIIRKICEYYNLNKKQLLGEGRSRKLVLPRQILMYILRKELKLPLEEIGRIVGGRDHTTVMHAVEKISNLISTNKEISEGLMRIKNFSSPNN